MSARKLGRLAGLVFVLAAMLGGVGAQHAVDGGASAAKVTSQIIDWE
jgi:hypothetical protein